MSYVLQVALRITPENVEAFMQVLRRDRPQGAGCRRFDVLVDPRTRTQVDALRDLRRKRRLHRAPGTDHFKRYLAEAVPLLKAANGVSRRSPTYGPPGWNWRAGNSLTLARPYPAHLIRERTWLHDRSHR